MDQAHQAFLKTAALAAIESQRATGVPASVTIAQAILESGWGCSSLARLANNFFGIKAAACADPGAYVEMPTHEVVCGHSVEEMAAFARYTTPAGSFTAHADLLARAGRYRPAMAVKADPFQFAAQLQACGYSTNPDYARLLGALIREFDLTQYDAPAATPIQAPDATATAPTTAIQQPAAAPAEVTQ